MAMTSTIDPVGASTASQAAQTDSTTAKTDASIVNKDDFLKLLVAQIKNQDPLNPTDGVQFLSQLAQFSQLEQLININTNMETLVGDAATTTPAAGSQPETGASAAA
jgi:flagellar basal-body rod modification protein FlgD